MSETLVFLLSAAARIISIIIIIIIVMLKTLARKTDRLMGRHVTRRRGRRATTGPEAWTPTEKKTSDEQLTS